jgi:thioredoxin-like negative regulator of GroEL
MTDRYRESMGSPLPKLDQFDFHAALADMTGPTLIMFTSPDCGSCRHLRRVLQEVNVREPGWQVFEVDAQRDPALANEFEVFHLPTIFLFNNGEFHCQLEAAARTVAIISATRSALLQPAGEAP